MNTAPNSPFKGYYPNVNPFGISPRYNGNTPLYNLYNKYKTDEVNDSISKVNDIEDANAEIEQGEIVRQELPNGGTLLHKALGKKHNKGKKKLSCGGCANKDKKMILWLKTNKLLLICN